MQNVGMQPAVNVASRTDRRPLAGAVYDPEADTTFVTWAGLHADSYIQAYDHATGVWTDPVWIGGGEDDPHNYPTIVLSDTGFPLVLRGMHNVDLRLSGPAKPHSIDGPWTTTTVPGGRAATYPMPVKLSNADIYVFFRETTKNVESGAPDDTRPMRYVMSPDSGKTWISCGYRYALGSTDRTDNMNEIYIGQIRHVAARTGRSERLELVWTLAGGGYEGPLHDRYHRNVYVASFEPSTRRFYAPSGLDLGEVIDDAAQEKHCRIVETPLERPGGVLSPDYIQLVDVLADGRHLALWMTADANGVPHAHAALSNSGGWQVVEVAEGLRLKEMEPIGGDTWRVYATRDGEPGVELYTVDGSLRWQAAGRIDTPKPVQRIELVTGGKPPARLLATGASTARSVTVADGDIYVLP